MRNLFIAVVSILFLQSCGSFTSTTEIESKNSFVLGNNKHGSFKIKIKNLSDETVNVIHEQVSGGSHSPQIIKPKETIMVQVDKNTALRFENNSIMKISVGLKIKGDTGLSMGYIN